MEFFSIYHPSVTVTLSWYHQDTKKRSEPRANNPICNERLENILLSPGISRKPVKQEGPALSIPNQRKVPNNILGLTSVIESYLTHFEPITVQPEELEKHTRFSELAPFQKSVLAETCRIPHGETRTYRWIAERIGNPRSVRAVGQALKKNPLPLLIPCHRVVSNKGQGGFMGVMDSDSFEVRLKNELLRVEHLWRNPVFSMFENLGQFKVS